MRQTYEEIKQSCLRSGRLYEDPDFKAIDDNIFTNYRPKQPFVWLRPNEIVNNPVLFDAGASRLDVVQGRLGNCWFLAAVASLTAYPLLLKRVCPVDDQSFDKKDYCGAFHFRFWQGGMWEDVTIDDRLPTHDGSLIFVHSKSSNEFWSALLEKAYAKLHGSYEALKGGQTSEAMEDFTSGMTESVHLSSKPPPNLFQIMLKAMQRKSLMGCSVDIMLKEMPRKSLKGNNIKAKADQTERLKLANGLIMGHAYTVTDLKRVKVKTRSSEEIVELVRVRNPWGNESEWKGAWSDRSWEWALVSDEERKEIELKFDDDGEFWMSYRDFIFNFQRLEICMLSPEMSIEDSKFTWIVHMHKDRWRIGCTAGGCQKNPDTFHRNPQFSVMHKNKLKFNGVTLRDVDDGDDDVDGSCTLVVSLMQVGRRKLKKELGKKSKLCIGFAIYKLEEEDLCMPRLDKDYFLYHTSIERSSGFTNARGITNRFNLKPGIYCIVPSTYEPNEEGEFLIRLFSEQEKKSDVQDVQTRITRKMMPVTASENAEMDRKHGLLFEEIAEKEDQIDAFELKEILEAVFSKDIADQSFNIETCRSLISLHDDSQTGKLEYDDFKETLFTIKNCHAEFKKYDKDSIGTINMYQLEDVLDALGIKTSKRCQNALICDYSNKEGILDFNDFLQIYTRVICLIETFNKHATHGSNKAAFGLDEFIEGALRA